MLHIFMIIVTAGLFCLAAVIIGDLVIDIFTLRGEARIHRNDIRNRADSCNHIHTIDSENTDNVR